MYLCGDSEGFGFSKTLYSVLGSGNHLLHTGNDNWVEVSIDISLTVPST